ncbi:hypothetical protein [Maribacter sp. HTCC2170]|uniref:hypothetical protein n=1 Tax=Maribacter sp. (strain HTCC2170 / KCCM 42371) TaxID=313603 RepID=UPI00006AFD7D|nr:hypothetical protein [Maribacter sp. HTCC2170]EAR01395.1 hypothetical protein FB2170_11761 [Maribacter sp. HTCC2170]
MKYFTLFFALIGVMVILYGIIGLTLDIISLYQTKGGHEYPYEGWTGKPVDWDALDLTQTGLVKRGYVLDVHVHGTTGMISFGFLGFQKNWQTFSDRALKVHKPKEAFLRRGFDPQF